MQKYLFMIADLENIAVVSVRNWSICFSKVFKTFYMYCNNFSAYICVILQLLIFQ